MKEPISPMSAYYEGKIVFLTGGSGFLGNLYIQKLLRTKISLLYLFMRPKRNESAEERLEKLFDNPVFDKLKLEIPNYLDKIKIIRGSLGDTGLGIDENDRNDIIDNVELVIHCAADVRFNRSLFELVRVNLCGTLDLLKLSTLMTKLRLFTYISTCYSNCIIDTVEERFYDPPIDPNMLIKLTESYADGGDRQEVFELLTSKFIHPWPNTYTFTKALSESVVKSFEKDIPVCVVRPSIVLSAYNDPEPGWILNFFGFIGILYGGGLGILRTVLVDVTKRIDFTCGDFVTNSTLAAIWSVDDDQFKKLDKVVPKVYSVSSGTSNPVTFGKLLETTVYAAHIPASRQIWFPTMTTTNNKIIYLFLHILLEVIPAVAFDTYFKCTGQKIRLLPIYRAAHYNIGALSYFIRNEWIFKDDNMRSVYEKMSAFDKKLFPSDIRILDWRNFIYDMGHGIRKYLEKDQGDWTSGFRRLSMLHNIHLFTKYFFYGLSVYVFYLIAMKFVA